MPEQGRVEKYDSRMRVWVVEWWSGKEWVPCNEVGLTRESALWLPMTWEKHSPKDKYRIRKYVPA